MVPTAERIARRCIRLGMAIVAPLVADRPTRPANTERHGSFFGGWRVLRDTLGPGSIVYSAGLGTDITFDLSLIRARGVEVHGFDPTPRSVAWLNAQTLPASFHFHATGLGGRDGTASFVPPLLPQFASFSMARDARRAKLVECEIQRLGTAMRALGHTRIDLLKMDIEGAEYDVIDDIASTRPDIRQILVEFHARFVDDGFARTLRAVSVLQELGYRRFWVAWNGTDQGFVRE